MEPCNECGAGVSGPNWDGIHDTTCSEYREPDIKLQIQSLQARLAESEKELYQQEKGQADQVRSMAAQISRISQEREDAKQDAAALAVRVEEMMGALQEAKIALSDRHHGCSPTVRLIEAALS